MKTRLNSTELMDLANAYVMSKIAADELKRVKATVKTDELQTTVVGESGGKTVHKPYKLDEVVEVQVIDSVRESVDTTALISKLAEFVDLDKLNEIVAECTKTSPVHTVNIKPTKEFSVAFESKLKAGLALLDELDNLKEEVRAKVLAMLKKANNS